MDSKTPVISRSYKADGGGDGQAENHLSKQQKTGIIQ